MKKAMFLAVCVTLIAAAPALCLSVPSLINYQGVLTDANGNLITGTLTKTMIFAVYDAANGGVMKWGPETQTVQIINGQFNVLLGSVLTNPAITTAFDGPERYLSIKVDNIELLPRQQVLSTGYAVQAERALHGVPVGTVVSYFGNTAPEGWLLCEGQSIVNNEKYINLRNLIGDTVPDLRGRVIAGAGQADGLTNRTIGEKGGEEVHKLTADEMPSHEHTVQLGANTNVGPDPWVQHSDTNGGNWGLSKTSSAGGNQAHNNMPPFYILNYIIKY